MTATTVRHETASWVEPVGRIGIATQAVLYLVVGLLALQVAAGQVGERTDQHGVIHSVASQPFGTLLLLVLTIGLALHCAWRTLLFLRGAPGPTDGKEMVTRIAHLGRAVIYGGFTLVALEVLVYSRGGTEDHHRDALARVLEWPAGQLIAVLLGLFVIAGGAWHMQKLFTQSFTDDLDLNRLSPRACRIAVVLGSIGYAARGAAFALVGWFFVRAAIDHDPNEGGGLDNALKRLVSSDYGPGWLRLLALGLVTFGAYRLVDAVIHKRDAVANA